MVRRWSYSAQQTYSQHILKNQQTEFKKNEKYLMNEVHNTFNALADHRVKLKESEKKDKYLDLARELKNMRHESELYQW